MSPTRPILCAAVEQGEDLLTLRSVDVGFDISDTMVFSRDEMINLRVKMMIMRLSLSFKK